MKDYFYRPPINKLSLTFLERSLESAYRISYQEEVCVCVCVVVRAYFVHVSLCVMDVHAYLCVGLFTTLSMNELKVIVFSLKTSVFFNSSRPAVSTCICVCLCFPKSVSCLGSLVALRCDQSGHHCGKEKSLQDPLSTVVLVCDALCWCNLRRASALRAANVATSYNSLFTDLGKGIYLSKDLLKLLNYH